MTSTPMSVRVGVFLLAIVVLGLLRSRPWRESPATTGAGGAAQTQERLVVGYLPVT